MEMRKTTIYLSVEQLAELDAIATRKGSSKAQVIREALTEYIVDQPQTLPSWIGSFDGAPVVQNGVELRSDTVDEWLAANWHPE
jgi:hypothetical protein